MGRPGLVLGGAAGLLIALSACAPSAGDPDHVIVGTAVPTAVPTAVSTAVSGVGGAASVPVAFRDADPGLEVSDQVGDGTEVLLEQVQLSSVDGFVAVYTARSERLLGHEAVPRSGEGRPVSVGFDLPVTLDVDLVAVLHADDGDGVFDPATDPRVVDDGQDLQVERFRYRVGR